MYGGKWVDFKSIPHKDLHFYSDKMKTGYRMCVGTPESFSLMNNVILENVRTAENMLIAYECYMNGDSKNLNLIAYNHGEIGRKQFKQSKTKYISIEDD